MVPQIKIMLEELGVTGYAKERILELAEEVIEATYRYIENSPFRGTLKKAMLHLIGRGKLIRPIFSLLISRGLGAKKEPSIRLASAIEFSHIASLIHDDIIDNADYRRGVRSVHRIFGLEKAIVTGDAFILLSNYLTADLGEKIIKESLLAGLKMCIGEIEELEYQDTADLREYYNIIYNKTATFFEHIARASSILGGVSDLDVERFGEIGKNLGMAFQIRDDILDIYGKEDQLGKPIFQDRNRPNIIGILKRNNMSDDEALKYAEKLLWGRIWIAKDRLDMVPLDTWAKKVLDAVLNSIPSRFR
jgi:geranylgeranyl pyrophosphate synthase